MAEPVYALLQVKVKDRGKLAAYVQGHLPSFMQYGGELVLRGEGLAPVKGDWLPDLFVVHRWPSEEAFRQSGTTLRSTARGGSCATRRAISP